MCAKRRQKGVSADTKDCSNVTLWGTHGGKAGDADSIFPKRNEVALGWDRMGGLSKLDATRDVSRTD